MPLDHEAPPALSPPAEPESGPRQHARLLAAMTEVAGERGWERTTLRAVVARAGVSRRTLYDLFGDKDACFLAAARAVTERVATLTRGAYDAAGAPQAGLARAISSLYGFFADEPSAARVYLVETAIAGPAGAQLWNSHMEAMSLRTRCALDALRSDLPPHSESMAIGGVYTVARTRVLAGRAGELANLAPEVQRALWLTLGVDGHLSEAGGHGANGG